MEVGTYVRNSGKAQDDAMRRLSGQMSRGRKG
jgi:hypothetical protein